MTKAQIIKAGGAMAVKVMDCAEILACFDPEIEFGSHSEMQGSLEHVEAYNRKTGAGYQAEHVPPCSTLHVSGRGGALFGAVKGTLYSTGKALTWMAHDGQVGTSEHKLLTEQMRRFSQHNRAAIPPKNATLKEWMAEYKKGVKNALTNATPKRKIKKPPQLDEKALIDKAADCIEAAALQYFKDAGVDEDTELRNAWKPTGDQVKAAKAAALSGTGGAV
jgi:hypothetical protein